MPIYGNCMDGCENENARRMKENMNEIGLQILNCV